MKLLLLLTTILICDAQEIYKYLNSYGHCESGPIIVDTKAVYILKADAQPETKTQSSLVSCELMFRAAEKDGQLCILQDGIINTLEDPNVELKVTDGTEDEGKEIFKLKYFPSNWSHREHCTSSHFLTIFLRRTNNAVPFDVSKLKIDLKVVNIENLQRKIYLDELFCDDSFTFINSVVPVYNRSPSSSTKTVKEECGVNIIKKSNRDSRLCLVYIPSVQPSLHSKWLFAVTKKEYSLEKENILYNLTWDDARIKSQHFWCASNETSKFMIILKRLEKSVLIEPPEALNFIVTDHVGPEEDLHKVVKKFSDTEEETDHVEYWVISVVVLFICFVFIIMVILKRNYLRKIFCTDYHQANTTPSKC